MYIVFVSMRMTTTVVILLTKVLCGYISQYDGILQQKFNLKILCLVQQSQTHIITIP